jgi:MATE family multidrug resistance protein
MALTVRMGEAWGAGSLERLRPLTVSAWLIAVSFSLISATIFLFFPKTIASGFLTDPTALQVTATLLVVSAAFQFGDGLQIVSMGGLRGLNDVTVPAWLAVFAYWVVALPVGWWLAFRLDWGVSGMWWGITLGLSLTALLLGVRLWRKSGFRA